MLLESFLRATFTHLGLFCFAVSEAVISSQKLFSKHISTSENIDNSMNTKESVD